ncbi:hypothetical protein AB2C51_34045, partial [Pseudomonas aeruginosa]
VAIVTDGVHCDPRRGTGDAWSVPVEVKLGSIDRVAVGVTVDVALLDPEGKRVAGAQAAATVLPLERATAALTLAMAAPRLWSIEAPTL